MRIVKLRDVSLTSSTVAGSTYAEYAAATTYALGDNVKVSFESDGTTPIFPVLEFESLAGSNLGKYPPDNPDKWSEIGAENRCKMFDQYTNTETVDASDIVVVVDASASDCVGIFGIYGTEVTLELIRDATVLKTETFDLRTVVPESGWYNWLFNYYDYGITQIIWDFPKYSSGATLQITITTRTSEAKCGMVAIGNARWLADTQYGPKVGIDDYSIKATDALGRTYLNPGAFAGRADISAWLPNENIDYVMRQLTELRGAAAIYNLNNDSTDYQSMFIYGYFQNFDINIPGPKVSFCNIEIKGLT